MTEIIKLQKQLTAEGGIPIIPVISSDHDYTLASDSIAYLNRHLKLAETRRKTETEPLLRQKQAIDAEYKTFTRPLEEVIAQIKSLMVGYSRQQAEAQKLLEAEATASAQGEDIIVDDLSVNKVRGEVSTSSLKTTTKYRIKDEVLRFIEIPQNKIKEYLKENKLPDWIEQYEEDTIFTRANF